MHSVMLGRGGDEETEVQNLMEPFVIQSVLLKVMLASYFM